jgi:hypothetical protein
MLNSHIHHILGQKNAILDDEEKLLYIQMFFITYKDRAPMMSTGGVVVRKKELRVLHDTKVFTLPYVRINDNALDIQSPILTNSEIDLINSHLPKSRSRFLKLKKLGFIPEEEKSMYHGVYRYYPSFVEVRDY